VVFKIQESTGYMIVDMPRGTELAREALRVNAIIEEMKRAEKTRMKPFDTWPERGLEWFPVTWLDPAPVAAHPPSSTVSKSRNRQEKVVPK
jgi:hypothetical protein